MSFKHQPGLFQTTTEKSKGFESRASFAYSDFIGKVTSVIDQIVPMNEIQLKTTHMIGLMQKHMKK